MTGLADSAQPTKAEVRRNRAGAGPVSRADADGAKSLLVLPEQTRLAAWVG